MGGDNQAQTELDEPRMDVETLNARPLSAGERDRDFADWTALQAKFADPSGDSTVEADHLIVEVIQLRAWRLSDLEQRAAEVSI